MSNPHRLTYNIVLKNFWFKCNKAKARIVRPLEFSTDPLNSNVTKSVRRSTREFLSEEAYLRF